MTPTAAEQPKATVKAHATAILRKLGASTRTQAVVLAGRLAREIGRRTAPEAREGTSPLIEANEQGSSDHRNGREE